MITIIGVQLDYARSTASNSSSSIEVGPGPNHTAVVDILHDSEVAYMNDWTNASHCVVHQKIVRL